MHGKQANFVSRIVLTLAAVFGFAVVAVQSVQAQTFKVLYGFQGGKDGANPYAGVTLDSAGNLYGTTVYGGGGNCHYGTNRGCGTVFKLDTTGKETILRSFTGVLKFPYGGVVLDSAGNIYGTTSQGGDPKCSCGAVFKLDSAGKETVLHTFKGTDGANPYANLILDAAGNLYGTTAGGTTTAGTVFKLDATGEETVLHNFQGGTKDGSSPYAPVILDAAGNLYGTTSAGGARRGGRGTVFQLSKGGKETLLFKFGGGSNGGTPYSGLVMDADGKLCGTTRNGGAFGYNDGVVFSLNNGKETVLHRFTGQDGSEPYAGLVMDSAGNSYGTTTDTVFEIDAAGSFTLLSTEAGSFGTLVEDAAGNLYGTSGHGTLGSGTYGTVWKLTP
jgi:uncharacterized repeat protein (TIGR03803 family)